MERVSFPSFYFYHIPRKWSPVLRGRFHATPAPNRVEALGPLPRNLSEDLREPDAAPWPNKGLTFLLIKCPTTTLRRTVPPNSPRRSETLAQRQAARGPGWRGPPWGEAQRPRRRSELRPFCPLRRRETSYKCQGFGGCRARPAQVGVLPI